MTATPVSQSERIVILDSLRGFAILGILLMNMPVFSLSFITGSDPSVLNEQGTINYPLWYGVEWIFDGTQRALFSMLFGAGIILFISRQEKKSDGLIPADYFFRRQLWLIAFSVFDVFILLWNGDILMDYAIYGMMMFAFRNLPARKLLIAAGICMTLMVAKENHDLFKEKQMISKGNEAAAIDTLQTKLTHSQKNAIEELKSQKERDTQKDKLRRLKHAVETVTESRASSFDYRTNAYSYLLVHYTYYSAWDVFTCMLLGMAFFKMGILTGDASVKTYWWLCLGGLVVGLGLSYWRITMRIDNHFSWMEYTTNAPISLYELSRIPRVIGLLGLLMLLFKSGLFKWFFNLLRPVGQMAFTNYLVQSLICGIIFNGGGLALFGKLQRYQVYEIVAAIWLFQIIFCHLWMRFFLYGPFEWSWRSLTYWTRQPFKRI